MMNLRRIIGSLAAAGVLLWGASTASALSVDGSGFVGDGWDFTPFGTEFGDWGNTGALGNESGQVGDGSLGTIVWAEGNNVSPLDYSQGTPSGTPYAVQGTEKYDMEFLGWRTVAGGKIQVLGIVSADPATGFNNFHIGDVFLNTDGNNANGYEMALTGPDWSTTKPDPLSGDPDGYDHTQGLGLYSTADTIVHGVTGNAGGGFGDNAILAPELNPLAIELTQNTQSGANAQFNMTSFNYGTKFGEDEDETYFVEWEFAIADLIGLTSLEDLTLHWTIECGNDLLSTPKRFSEPDEVIPEPATLVLTGLGLFSMGMMRRRRERRA